MESISRKLKEIVQHTYIDPDKNSKNSESLPDQLSSTFTQYSEPISVDSALQCSTQSEDKFKNTGFWKNNKTANEQERKESRKILWEHLKNINKKVRETGVRKPIISRPTKIEREGVGGVNRCFLKHKLLDL